MKIHLNVNGQDIETESPPLRRLIDVLRDDLGLVAAKIGCGEGECGSCNVHLDGAVVSACLVPVIQADGCRVDTLEGLANGPDPALETLRESFLNHDASQCGACVPGIVMTCLAMPPASQGRCPTVDEVRMLLAGNLCRCTGYSAIVRSVADWLGANAEK